MEICKWDFKTDGYHPHEPGLRKKLTGLGFDKVTMREIQPGAEIATKNATEKDQALAVLGGRIFLKVVEETLALHQGDIVTIVPETDVRLKASGNTPAKVLLARK